jgi:hypothetical protein
MPFELLRLQCPQCGSQIAAEGEDVVYYCVSCRSGYRLNAEAANRLAPVEVSFVTAPAAQVERWLPFWAIPARIALEERIGSSTLLGGLFSLFAERKEAPAEPGDGTFAVPAFAAPLAEITALATRYTQELPRLGERLGERLTGGRLAVADAEKLAHFVLVASEAAKPDTLKDLSYTLDFGPARLLGVPFVRRGEAWADAHFGLPATLAERA